MHLNDSFSASIKIIDAHFLIIIAKKLIKIKARRRYLLYFLCYSLTFDVRFATIRSWNILFDARFLVVFS